MISQQSTWPNDVLEFLTEELDGFSGWECDCCGCQEADEYESLLARFHGILRQYSLTGYHCTRLTVEEIERVKSDGMMLQDPSSLSARIDSLLSRALIDPEIAERLQTENQAGDENRAYKIWFCFFKPFMAGERGIERFFRSWGGESLYNCHESDSVAGSAIRNIGTPCIVKADVPIKYLSSSKFPDSALVSQVLSRKGHHVRKSIEHAGYSTQNLSKDFILDIFEYPGQEFVELTKCNLWRDGLS